MCTIIGRGTVVTGKLEHGVIKKGDEAVIMGHGKQFKTTVTGMSLDKTLNYTVSQKTWHHTFVHNFAKC